MEHFAWMVAVSRTARKVIHQVDGSGTTPYAGADEEARRLGLTRMTTAEEPASGIGARTQKKVRRMRQAWLDVMKAPDGWPEPALRIPRGWPGEGEVWRPQHHDDASSLVGGVDPRIEREAA